MPSAADAQRRGNHNRGYDHHERQRDRDRNDGAAAGAAFGVAFLGIGTALTGTSFTIWFSRKLSTGVFRAAGHAIIALVAAMIGTVPIALLFAK